LRRGDLITVALSGDYGKPRPALVIQSDEAMGTSSVTVLLLTSDLLDAPYFRHTVQPSAENGLRIVSQVQIDRAMSLPRTKAGPTIGRLDDQAMISIGRNLAVFLGIA
jgi:mRNA interferase MazF